MKMSRTISVLINMTIKMTLILTMMMRVALTMMLKGIKPFIIGTISYLKTVVVLIVVQIIKIIMAASLMMRVRVI